MAELETPVTADDTKGLVPTRITGDSMLDRWVNHDPDAAMLRLDTMVKMLERLRLAAIKATYPSDWIIHTSKDTDGNVIRQVAYLQDCGAERAGKIFGIEVGSPAIEREDFPDGTYTYNLIAEAWSKVTGERLDYAEGSRWSGDRFFTRGLTEGDKPDPTDIRKAAYANLHGRAVRSLSGLSAVPLDMLQHAGVDVGKVVMIGYEKGGKGGESAGAQVGTAEVVIGFGRSQGKRPDELADADLTWCIRAYTENVGDPKKERFHKANQRVLDALLAEQDKRKKAASQAAEVGTTPAGTGAQGGEAQPTSRGKKVGDLHVRLSDASKNNARTVAAMLRLWTKEHTPKERSANSELTDQELDQFLALTDAQLADLATRATAPKE